MTGHRLEVADVFHAHENEFLQRWAMHCRTSSGRCCAISACAAQRRWALIWNDVIAAVMRPSLTTRAAIGTVPSVSLQHATVGSSSRPQVCYRCPTPMWSSPYLSKLAPLALRNQRLFYSLLFRAASETLMEIAADPRHLGARIGVLAVLHTWSQNLQHHPHLHCLVPAGGMALITPAGSQPDAEVSSSLCASSAACSAASCSPSSSRATGAANYASPASG